MVAKLEEARMQYSAAGDDGFDREGSRQRFEEAFAWYGLDTRQGSPEEVAARIETNPIREEIVIALDRCLDTKDVRLVLCVPKANVRSVRRFKFTSSVAASPEASAVPGRRRRRA